MVGSCCLDVAVGRLLRCGHVADRGEVPGVGRVVDGESAAGDSGGQAQQAHAGRPGDAQRAARTAPVDVSVAADTALVDVSPRRPRPS